MLQVMVHENGFVKRLTVEAILSIGSAADDKGLMARLVERDLLELCTS